MATAYVTHPRLVEHNLPDHPEHAGRLRAVWDRLKQTGLLDRLLKLEAQPAEENALLAVHTADYIDLLRRIGEQTRMVRLDADTYAAPVSSHIARLAAGCAIEAASAVANGTAENSLAVVRPPGHHAVPARGMGFCLLNNVAVAARYVQRAHNLEKIMIVDYDVHHGNGTEAVFYADPSVLFLSTHQYPLYPGTGALDDIGEGEGKGFTINIPLPSGHGDESYAAIYEQIVWKAAERFKPDMIFVSAGFDAHWTDPLASTRLTLTGYDHITRELIRMAQTFCGGKITFVMEGGYHLETLSWGWANIAHALLGEGTVNDPLGEAPTRRSSSEISSIIAEVRHIHRL